MTALRTHPRILGLGTAVTENVIQQDEARALGERLFLGRLPGAERLLEVFTSVRVQRRQVACPLAWYETPRPFPEKNAVYREVATALAVQAARRALADAETDPSDIGGLLFVSSTGLAAPSLDARLIQTLGLSRAVARLPLWGLGCAGGGGGLARASLLARALDRPVLLVTAEICSATFVHADVTRQNLIATALFGDGAAAAVLGPVSPGGGDRPEILIEHGQLFDDTEDVMGWDLVAGGLQVRFARSIPAIVRTRVPGVVRDARQRAGVSDEPLVHFMMHPGGPRVLEAYEQALEPPRDALQDAWDVLREHGNMSSPTVLFVLEAYLRRVPAKGALGLLMGLGPGFCAEGILFRW